MIHKSSIVSIALAANHRYLPGLMATMASLILSASDRGRLRFHVFADGLTEDDCQDVAELARRLGAVIPVEFHHPDMTRIQSLFKPYNGSHAAFLRLFFCEFLQEERIVYSDVDVLWFRDVCELWRESCDDVSLAWCRDLPSIARGVKDYSLRWNPSFDETRYACSGVMLMNLKRMRETGFVDKCVDFAKRWGTPFFVDQDILNFVCFDDARILSQCWDLMMPDRRAADGGVVHFNGVGRMFNGPMIGWRPLYWLWYRFYYDIVLEGREKRVCGRFKSLVFWLLGSIYPDRRLVRLFTWPFRPQVTDQIQRQLFFAWLWRHANWMGTWRT